MYAIFKSGGKQYKVQAGDLIKVEKIDLELGSEFDLSEILAIGGDKTVFGSPLVKDAKITFVVTRQDKGEKVIVFKKKRRQGYRKMRGHRQLYTELFVKEITSPDGLTSGTDKKPTIIDPIRTAQRKAAAKEAFETQSKAAPAKKVAKKVTKKAAKKVAKKTATKKATTKKATAKKTTKKTSKK